MDRQSLWVKKNSLFWPRSPTDLGIPMYFAEFGVVVNSHRFGPRTTNALLF